MFTHKCHCGLSNRKNEFCDGSCTYQMKDYPLSKINTETQKGWECPRCHAINAPFKTQCDCKPLNL